MSAFTHAFASRRMAVILLLGFVSGLPLGLVGGTLQAWMTDQKVDLAVIGLFALVGLPYGLKFLWAPLLDRFAPPGALAKLGRRRGWLILTQVSMMLAITGMAFSEPAKAPVFVAALALLVTFSSASYDIIFDAYKIEILENEEFGIGAGVGIMGYRLAMIVSGGLAFIMADHMPWKIVYFIMAVIMGIGPIATLLAPNPKVEVKPRDLKEAVTLPFVQFFANKGAIQMLVFLLLYKLDVMMTMAMTTPFMLSIGFTKTEIGSVVKVFGMIATIVGTIFGGGLMMRLGLQRALWVFGIAQAVSGLSYMLLAHVGHSYPMMVTAITFENLFSGMGIAAYSALMMSLCDRRYTATQYALLSSFMALSRYLAQAPSGYLVKSLGWEQYFLVCTLISIPGLLLLTRYRRWTLPNAMTA